MKTDNITKQEELTSSSSLTNTENQSQGMSFTSFFKAGIKLYKSGIEYIIDNPGKSLTMLLAMQSTSVKSQNMNDINLATLTSSQGFAIDGANQGDQSGTLVSTVGDINGDGISDIIVGASSANNNAGASYVIYGKAGGYTSSINFTNFDFSTGFTINGANQDDLSGASVSTAGDINNDGISDIIVGARGANGYAGASYIIYGKIGGYPSNINLATMDSSIGFAINGANQYDLSGYSVSSAGDINNDGISDVIVGAININDGAGASYVIYGKTGGYPSNINLATMGSSIGFAINGANQYDNSGAVVSGAGDINNDGISDIMVSTFVTNNNAGISYIIYGKTGGYSSSINLATLTSSQGFTINGADQYDYSGYSLNNAKDINGDGISDIIIGAIGINYGAGASYIVYGKTGGYSNINLANFNSNIGFAINGTNSGDKSGCSVSSAGDINNDGVGDVIIGAYGVNSQAGRSYVVYGVNFGSLSSSTTSSTSSSSSDEPSSSSTTSSTSSSSSDEPSSSSTTSSTSSSSSDEPSSSSTTSSSNIDQSTISQILTTLSIYDPHADESSADNHNAAIIGGTIGGFAGLALTTIGIIGCVRYFRDGSTESNDVQDVELA